MRKLPPLIKRMPPAPSPVEPDAARIPIAAPAGTGSTRGADGAQDKTCVQLHREVGAASEGGPTIDPSARS